MKHDFLSPSPLPGGLPDLSAVTAEDLDALLTEATCRQKEVWESIAENGAPADFENTIVPLEESAAEFNRALGMTSTFEGSLGTPEILAFAERWAPRLAEHQSSAARNPHLVQRLLKIDADSLTPEQSHLVSEWRKRFEAEGAFVPEEHREELATIEAELATLESEFSSTLLEGATAAAFVTDRVEDLAGLSPADIERAAKDAAELGHEGRWALKPDLFCAPGALAAMTDAAARRRFYANSVNRGRGSVRDSGTAETPENLLLAARMSALRARRAQIFGAACHADLVLRQSVAGSTSRALDMLEGLVPKALANFSRELGIMAEVAGVDRSEIRASDVPHLLARVARERYSVDEDALKPYFELDRVLADGVFFAANRLFGLEFRELADMPVWHPGVRIWEVRDEDGQDLGLFAGDFFARSTKQGGAWMHDLVPHNGMDGTRPVVCNTLNIPEPAQGQPALLSVDNLRTLFHEFGHALHSLLTKTGYVTNSGTNVPRDFVEYPSQVNEMWMFAPGVVENYAVHVETGERLPTEVIEKIRESALWGEGFKTSEYLGAALLDMAWHTRGTDAPPLSSAQDVRDFEDAVLSRYGFDRLPVSPRYRTGNFKHIFGGGYSAGYYSYIFSEMMDAETVAWFNDRGGLNRESGEIFRRRLLETGNRQDPAQSFRDLLGRDPQIDPLLVRRGLADAA